MGEKRMPWQKPCEAAQNTAAGHSSTPVAWENKTLAKRLSAQTGITGVTLTRYLREFHVLLEKNTKAEIISSPENVETLLALNTLLDQGFSQEEIICRWQKDNKTVLLPGPAVSYSKTYPKPLLLLPSPPKANFYLLAPAQGLQLVEQLNDETVCAAPAEATVQELHPEQQAKDIEDETISTAPEEGAVGSSRKKIRLPIAVLLSLAILLMAVLVGVPGNIPFTDTPLPARTTSGTSWEGGIYTGETQGGMPHGHGTIIWPDGTVYTGQWQRGTMEGEGEIKWPSGAQFEGFWKEGLKHGRGKLTLPVGEVLQGYWEYDRLQ